MVYLDTYKIPIISLLEPGTTVIKIVLDELFIMIIFIYVYFMFLYFFIFVLFFSGNIFRTNENAACNDNDDHMKEEVYHDLCSIQRSSRNQVGNPIIILVCLLKKKITFSSIYFYFFFK